jgi:DNA invertase Pin-like site-specific DNA recombinase
MMVAAAYLRRSTDQRLSEEERSVTRQKERAQRYAELHGWTLPDELIFEDDSASGGEFVRRPDFLRLMNSLTPRPSFQILLVSEPSRIGREQTRTLLAFSQIISAGVRIFSWLDNKEWKLDTAEDKLLLSLANYVSEAERERGRQAPTTPSGGRPSGDSWPAGGPMAFATGGSTITPSGRSIRRKRASSRGSSGWPLAATDS